MAKLILEGSLEAELLEELQVSRYKRSSSKRGYRNGHYQRNLYTMYGVIKSLRVPCARGIMNQGYCHVINTAKKRSMGW